MLKHILICFVTCLLLLLAPELQAQQTPQKTYKMAVLPTITYLNKEVLREGIDSVSWHNIQRNEAYSNQSRNYIMLTQKRPSYNVFIQPFAQTNALLDQAGISYTSLATLKHDELAAILGVDLLFYGVNYRVGDGRTPEERLAANLAITALLPPLMAGAARATDKPITSMHYLLFDADLNKAVWHYQEKTKRVDTAYLDKLQQFLTVNFPKTR